MCITTTTKIFVVKIKCCFLIEAKTTYKSSMYKYNNNYCIYSLLAVTIYMVSQKIWKQFNKNIMNFHEKCLNYLAYYFNYIFI